MSGNTLDHTVFNMWWLKGADQKETKTEGTDEKRITLQV